MTKTLTTLTIVALSGSAMAQSGLDIDRAYAAELRADADTRSSLLGNTGPGIGVDIFTQFRYTYNTRDGVAGVDFGDNDTTLGFSTPRTQIRLHGGVEGTDITGHVSFDFGDAFDGGLSGAANGDATLRDAYGVWGIDDNWTFMFGQMRNPLFFESSIAPEYSQGVERSIVHSFFDVGYTQGIALQYADDTMKFVGVLSDGPAIQTGGTTPANSLINAAAESDISLTGRVDFLFEGNWDQFQDFASWRGSNNGIRVGGGIHYSTRGDTNPGLVPGSILAGAPALVGGVDTEDIFAWTIDAQYESDGWGVFAAYQSLGVSVDGVTSGDADATFDAFILQGNVFISDQTEVYARYSTIFLEDDAAAGFGLPAGAEDQYSTLVAGLNYYLVPESYAARFSLDVAWALEDTSGFDTFMANDSQRTGFQFGGGGANFADEEIMIRAQMSLLF